MCTQSLYRLESYCGTTRDASVSFWEDLWSFTVLVGQYNQRQSSEGVLSVLYHTHYVPLLSLSAALWRTKPQKRGELSNGHSTATRRPSSRAQYITKASYEPLTLPLPCA